MSLEAQIRQALAELELISHAPVQGYGARTRSSDEEIGGKRPPGSDGEHRPCKPSMPFIEGDQASEKAWAEYDEELAAWEACYHRKTVDHYRRLLKSRGPSDALLSDVRATVECWRRTPIPVGQEPEYGSPQWKRYIADSREDPGALATRFNCTRRYINMIRQQYRKEAA